MNVGIMYDNIMYECWLVLGSVRTQGTCRHVWAALMLLDQQL